MADPLLAWNDPNVPKSSLQIYLENGGDPSRAAEFLYASSAKGNTALEQTNDFMRDRTPAEMQQIRDSENEWASHFLGSGIYNPGGANSYAIQNATGPSIENRLNSLNQYTKDPSTGKWVKKTELPALATIGNGGSSEQRVNPNTTTTTGNNNTSGGLVTAARQGGRSDSMAYSGAPQYTQSASLGNQSPYLSGMYQAQNYSPIQSDQSTTGLSNSSPSRGINFSKALWR